MLIVIKVLLRNESHDRLHRIQVVFVFIALLRIAWDIKAAEVGQFASNLTL